MPCKEKYATKPNTPTKSLRQTCPDVADQWHPTKNGTLTPDDVSKYSRLLVWWQCPNGHEWQQAIPNFVRFGHCQQCRKEVSSLTQWCKNNNRPDLIKEWHPIRNKALSPDTVSAKSNTLIWWQCSNGHVWNTKICNRTYQNSGCPYCNGKYSMDKSYIYKICTKCGHEWRTSSTKKTMACPKCYPKVQLGRISLVEHVETGHIYESVSEASRATNIPQDKISKCCLHIKTSTRGQHFRYVKPTISKSEKTTMESKSSRIKFTDTQIAFLKYSLKKFVSDAEYANRHISYNAGTFEKYLKHMLSYMNERAKTGITAKNWCQKHQYAEDTITKCRHYFFNFINDYPMELKKYSQCHKSSTHDTNMTTVEILPAEKDPIIVELPFTYPSTKEQLKTVDDMAHPSLSSQDISHSEKLASPKSFTTTSNIVICIGDVRVEAPQDIDPENLKSIIKAVRES